MLPPYRGKRILPFYGRQASESTTVHSLTPKTLLVQNMEHEQCLKTIISLHIQCILLIMHGHTCWLPLRDPVVFDDLLYVDGWSFWVTRSTSYKLIQSCLCISYISVDGWGGVWSFLGTVWPGKGLQSIAGECLQWIASILKLSTSIFTSFSIRKVNICFHS